MCQNFVRTSQIIVQSDRVPSGQATLLNTVTEFRWDKPLVFTENKSNFIFRVKTQAEWLEDFRQRTKQHSQPGRSSFVLAARQSLRFTSVA